MPQSLEEEAFAIWCSKAALAFAQVLCVCPDGGIRVSLPPLDDMRFRVVEQMMGARAEKTIVFSKATRQVRDEMHWTVDGHRFVAASAWRDPMLADWTRLRAQEVAHESF